MELKQINTVEEDIVSTQIIVSSLGTGTISPQDELEMLHDQMVNLEYAKISFDDFVKVSAGGTPIIVPSTDPDAEEVELKLINKVIPLDENFEVSLSIDVKKIPASAITTQLSTPLLVAQAQLIVFAAKIKDEVERLLIEIRAAENDFEGEDIYTI